MEQTAKHKIEFTAVSGPAFINAEKTAITCEVKFTHFDRVLPFNAVIDDDEEHGRRIYQYCMDGLAGDIAEFQPEKVDHVGAAIQQKEMLSVTAESQISILQRAARLKMASEAELANLDEWERYSVLLQRVTPEAAPDILWPTAPES